MILDRKNPIHNIYKCSLQVHNHDSPMSIIIPNQIENMEPSYQKDAYTSLHRIRCILDSGSNPLHVQCSYTNPRNGNKRKNMGASQDDTPLQQDETPLQQDKTLLQQNETLLQQIAELKRENQMMANKLQKIDVELQCIMCSDVSEEDVVLKCGHHFCRPCLSQWQGTGRTNGKNCPTCIHTPFVTETGHWDVVEHRAFRNIAEAMKYTKIFPVDQKYIGDLSEDGLRHGQGRCIYPNGDEYEGEWVNDQVSGNGIFTKNFPGNEKYVGDLSGEGLRHGQGRCTYPNGDVYEGAWVNDQRHGMGKITYVNGEGWEGPWHNNRKHGLGAHFWAGDPFTAREIWENDIKIPLSRFFDASNESLMLIAISHKARAEFIAKFALAIRFRNIHMPNDDDFWLMFSFLYDEMTFSDWLLLNNNPQFREAKIQEARTRLAHLRAQHAGHF